MVATGFQVRKQFRRRKRVQCTYRLCLYFLKGYQDDGDDYLDDVEVVDLSSDPQLPCLMPAQYPVGEYGGVGTYLEDSVLICGGKFGSDNYTNICFRYFSQR